MKFQAATVIAGAAMAAGANAQQAVQWRTEDGGNGHWYAVRTAGFPRTWNDCRVTALHEGGHLASLTNASEHAFVLAQAQATAGAWSGGFGPVLGGFQPIPNGGPAANWTWVTGESWALEKWIDGEPNDHAECGPGGDERFLAFLVDGWNDVQDVRECFGAWLVPSFVIEWSADCNNDGIVDYGQCRDGSLPDYDGDNVPDCCERGVACEVGAYPVEWRATEGGNGHWYRTLRTTTRTNFDFKVGAARSIGAELASIADGNENQFVFTMARASGVFAGRVCIGGRRCDGCPWGWVDGTPWSFEPWGPGEPGNPGDVHVEMFISIGAPGTWADVWDFDGSERAYAVEWSADCDSDGIVDYGQILRGERPDANANGVPDGCECFADLNSDGYVQGADLGLMLSSWGTAPAGTAADVNRDGAVDGNDLGLLLATWGPCGN